ncbi:MAG: hypothetical protein ACRDP9_23900 [Kribbellaceae bacterium]
MVGAETADQFLVVLAGDGDDGETAMLGKLDGIPADAARRTGDQQGLAGDQVEPVHRLQRGQRVQAETRRRDRVDVPRCGRDRAGVEHDGLGVRLQGPREQVDEADHLAARLHAVTPEPTASTVPATSQPRPN